MQTRLLASLAGGLLGAAVAIPVGANFNLSPVVAMIACSVIGLGLGYAISIFLDVFSSSTEDAES